MEAIVILIIIGIVLSVMGVFCVGRTLPTGRRPIKKQKPAYTPQPPRYVKEGAGDRIRRRLRE